MIIKTAFLNSISAFGPSDVTPPPQTPSLPQQPLPLSPMDCYGHNLAAKRAASATSNGSDNEDLIVEAKAGRAVNFAEKIHMVLSNKECRDAIAWLPSGRSFCITNKEKFVQTILPKFLKSKANFNSFERRLKTWGFTKIDASSKVYVFQHESFRRDSRAPHETKDEGNSFNVAKQLRIVLSNPEFQSFMWWLPSGESFCVSSTSELASRILFQYFGETQFKNFVASLKREKFQRVKTTEWFGEAVYSHEYFRVGRPDLCSLMSRGGSADASVGQIQGEGLVAANFLADPYFLPSVASRGCVSSYPQGGLASLHQSALNPAMMAQRSNLNANFPIPVNNGANNGAVVHRQAAQMPAASMPQAQQSSHYPFSFNGMNHAQSMSHLQMRLAQNQQDSFMSRSQILQGQGASSSLIMHQQQRVQDPSQQQLMSAMSSNSQRALTHDKNLLTRRHSLLSANQQLHQQLRKSQEYTNSAAMAQRRTSAPTLAQPAMGQVDVAGTDPANMTILEIDDELLRVKELKLLMLKRKLEAQIESNEQK